MLQVIFEKVDSGAKIPTKGSNHAACWDVYALEDCSVVYGQVAKVRTGLKVQIPHGYMLHIVPRSGLAFKNAVIVLGGIIDSDYRGELIVGLGTIDYLNEIFYTWDGTINKEEFKDESIKIQAGDRIAQIQLHPVPEWECIEGKVDDNTERGAGGFGSTGR